MSPRRQGPPRITSRLLTGRNLKRAKRLAQAEQVVSAEPVARMAALEPRQADEARHPAPSPERKRQAKRKLSAAHRAKISQALKGRKRPAKTRAKISRALKGHKVSAETRAKISRRVSLTLRGEGNPRYWHGAYVTPVQPVKSVKDVIADLSAKQARISALLDYHLDLGPELTPEVLTLISLYSSGAGKLGQLLRYQESQQADSQAGELQRLMNQALDELAKETGWNL